jgi:hypothetical protein
MIHYPIVELRQYTLRPGRRDTLIELFDREFVETQEAVGMAVLGQFRDLDAPDRFVWLRGFPDMASRAESLAAFYGGPVWQAHGRAANGTMIDSDDVLLLRPVADRWAFPEPAEARPPVGRAAPASLVLVTLCFADRPFDGELAGLVEHELSPAPAAADGPPVACLSTEYAENTYPALPVRTGEHVLAWIARFPSDREMTDHLRTAQARTWPAAITRIERLRLAPTARSLLR